MSKKLGRPKDQNPSQNGQKRPSEVKHFITVHATFIGQKRENKNPDLITHL